MTKIYISMPMRGRTDENIQKSFDKVEKLARILLDDDVVVVNPFKPHTKKSDKIPVRHDVQALGESISLLSLADRAFFVDELYRYPGCIIERDVCRNYEIPWDTFGFEHICPDVVEMRRAEELGVSDLVTPGNLTASKLASI